MNRLLDKIIPIINPLYWASCGETCRHWDKKLNNLMDLNTPFEKEGRYTVKMGGFIVWVENYPYGYGEDREDSSGLKPHPKMSTRRRLKRYIQKHQDAVRKKRYENKAVISDLVD